VQEKQAILSPFTETAASVCGWTPPHDVLRFADVVLDEARHEVYRGGMRVELTATEFNLLRYFLLNPRRVLSTQPARR
jgi:DNA-binding response OmpR family regulator